MISDKIIEKLSQPTAIPKAQRLLTVIVYGWFIINVMMIWNVRDYLWGINNVFYRQGHADDMLQNFFYQLIYDAERFHPIFYTHIICVLLSLIERRWSFIPRLLTWITGLMLYYAATEAFNSGMQIMLLLSFYCSFIYTKDGGALRNVLTNLARYACTVQVVMVYLTAAIYKLSGQQWLAGDALYFALHIDYLSSSWMSSSSLIRSMLVYKTLTYAGLMYQIAFPILIWFKKSRLWFLAVGIIFHLFIGCVMHLWDFAIAMIFCYALFLPEKYAGKMLFWQR